MANTRDEAVIRALGEPRDLGWVVMAHGELYAAEFGWDRSFEELVARIVADYAAAHDPGREAAWIAELGGARVGCVFCVAGEEPGTARLRILLVDPGARGRGLGGRLVDECVRFARDAGTSASRCGPTTRSWRPGASTRPAASRSGRRSRTAASAPS